MTIEMTDSKYLVRHSLKYGLMLSVLVTPFLGASLYVNPEIFVNDYPPDIREAVGPMNESTRRQAMVAASVILPIMIGVPIYSLVRLKRQRPHLSFRSAFLSTFIVGNVFNLYDLVVLDWLIFIVIQPELVVLPGTEGMVGYQDYFFHLVESTWGLAGITILSLVIALIGTRPWKTS